MSVNNDNLLEERLSNLQQMNVVRKSSARDVKRVTVRDTERKCEFERPEFLWYRGVLTMGAPNLGCMGAWTFSAFRRLRFSSWNGWWPMVMEGWIRVRAFVFARGIFGSINFSFRGEAMTAKGKRGDLAFLAVNQQRSILCTVSGAMPL